MVNSKKNIENRREKIAQVVSNVSCQLSNVKCLHWSAKDGFDVTYNLTKGDWQIYFHLQNLPQKLSTKINLLEKGSSVKIFGLFLGLNADYIDWDFELCHQKNKTRALILIKGILDQSGQTHFTGNLTVAPKLTEVQSTLRHETLLLSDQAKALVIPSLDIKSQSTEITHASTLSTLDQEQLFYLSSRNCSFTQAKKILVNGFLSQVQA